MGWFNHQLAKAMLGEKTHHPNPVEGSEPFGSTWTISTNPGCFLWTTRSGETLVGGAKMGRIPTAS